MNPLDALLIGVLAPSAAASAIALGAGRHGAAGLGLGAGVLLVFIVLLGWPGLPPVDATHWAPLWAVAAGALGLWPKGRAEVGRVAVVGAVAAVASTTLVSVLSPHLLSGGEVVLWVLGMTVVAVGVERLLSREASDARRGTPATLAAVQRCGPRHRARFARAGCDQG